ncbi:MAG: type I-C CRISPR-associated endonuclease Cas1c [Verrucomicrobiales bacterium]|nr:type I-C CRISPR-associated endonuclease Cas1c [Verrucomicrobiales bacterium]
MKQHLNTLFVTLEGAYLRKDGATVEVRHDGESQLRVPLHNLDGIATFGWNTTVTTALMAACGDAGVSLSYHSPHGKFLASTTSGVSGNIVLRRSQYRASDEPVRALSISRNCIAAKIANSRNLLQRQLRDHPELGERPELVNAVAQLKNRLGHVRSVSGHDSLRGIEGEAAKLWFGALAKLNRNSDHALQMNGRSRRPPMDPVNALLSFVYVLLSHDCRSACESVGLDPQCGFFHKDRPGRHSLALDLMEEFRPVLADRLVLTLLNRGQVSRRDFETKENGAVILKPDSRKTVLTAWQERKRDEIVHPFLEEKTTIGLLPFIQARILARYLRGDLDAYPAMVWKS